MLDKDDRHLDFRLSVLLTARPDGGEDLTATTAMRWHNLLGRGTWPQLWPATFWSSGPSCAKRCTPDRSRGSPIPSGK